MNRAYATGILVAALTACSGSRRAPSGSSTGGSIGVGGSGSIGIGGSTGSTSGSTGGSTGTLGAGSATLTGEMAFPVASANESRFPDGHGGFDPTYAEINLSETDLSAWCGPDAGPAVYQAHKRDLIVDLGQISGAAIGPGAYPIDPNSTGARADVLAYVGIDDGGTLAAGTAVSGAVTLAAADASHLAGSFDVAMGFDDGGTSALQGSFDADFCGAIR